MSKNFFLKINNTVLIFILWMVVGSVHAENNVLVKPGEHSNSFYINNVYQQIDFGSFEKVNPMVFEKAYQGFANLMLAHKLNSAKQIITICDYSLSANTKRLWVIDLRQKKVLSNSYVAHGQGTGEEFASEFSNKENSHQSSIGFYVTGNTYKGEHGLSLFLHGMDEGFNSAAYQRSIVLHGAAYVCESFINAHKRLGRSWGCPAVSSTLAPQLIPLLKEGTCLFAYYPSAQYLSTSYWLKKSANFLLPELEQSKFELAVPQQPEGNEVLQLVNK